jgi:DNA-binding response OmpR family regulator
VQAVSRFLGAEGYCVQTVQTRGLGIDRALSGNYDLVVLDVMLPEWPEEMDTNTLSWLSSPARLLLM